MKMHIRYRLIQILEILLWLGAVAGLGMVARNAWALRDQGYGAMLDAAGPGLLAIGAAMAALIVLIGIYHNSRRSAEAMDRMSRQSASGARRLPGALRGDVPAAVMPAPAPAAAYAPAPAYPAPVAKPVAVAVPAPVAAPAPVTAPVAAPAPAPVFSAPAPNVAEPAPVIPHVVTEAAPSPEPARVARPVMRAGLRRLGPAH